MILGIDDPCKNPDCAFRSCCGLRPAPGGELSTPCAQLAPTKTAAERLPYSFTLRAEPCGTIGMLTIEGQITDSLAPTVDLLNKALPALDGLFVYLRTPGGGMASADRLEQALLRARSRMPVVAFAFVACSAGVLLLVSATEAYAESIAVIGCFGVARHFCADGRGPRFIVSRQSPEKNATPDYPPDELIEAPDEIKIRDTLSKYYEFDLRGVKTLRKLSDADIRPWLNGRTFFGRQAAKLGLIDGCCEEAEAYARLLQLIEEE